MNKEIIYHRKYQNKPYGSYTNLFVFTGDGKRRNINKICLVNDQDNKPDESDYYVFQRHILYKSLNDDQAFLKIKQNRINATYYFKYLLELKLSGTDIEFNCECLDICNIPKNEQDYKFVRYVDPLICHIEEFKKIGDCSTDILFYNKMTDELIARMVGYTRPYDDLLHLHIGHGSDPNCCSTEQADVREGGYALYILPNDTYVYGHYWVGINCPQPLIMHFESPCPEQIIPSQNNKKLYKPIVTCENENENNNEDCIPYEINVDGIVSKNVYTRLICYEENNGCKRSGILEGTEVVISDKCFIRKIIRNVLTFPCPTSSSNLCKSPPNPEICNFNVSFETCVPYTSNGPYATGLGLIVLNRRNYLLTWNIMYQNLSSLVTSVYIYDCSLNCNNILFYLGKYSCGLNNPLQGSIDLRVIFNDPYDLQTVVCNLLENKWCLCVKTECNPSGELKGIITKQVTYDPICYYDNNCCDETNEDSECEERVYYKNKDKNKNKEKVRTKYTQKKYKK